MKIKIDRIGIIGLGYVGLPLAVEFGNKFSTVGFDINQNRVNELNKFIDNTNEVSSEKIKKSKMLEFTSDLTKISDCNIYIITVPTPIDEFKTPDLRPLIEASKMIGSILKPNNIIIYESTVFPGCTEEVCVPILEEKSGLKFNIDFFCGYSPERIVPGDKKNTLVKITKVTSGSNPEIADFIDSLYNKIIMAGTFKAKSIKVAEASKAIENAQRDLNISFVNELALIFDRLDLDTQDVLDAAGTKWNFLKYKPGLVGGHCISVDPYYLTYKAESVGYYPDVILSGRRVNDNMSNFVSQKLIKLLIKNNFKITSSNVLILGVTFKENCPDIRNTKVIDVYNELVDFGLSVDVYDPIADKNEVKKELGINLSDTIKKYDGILLAVAHNIFSELKLNEIKSSKNTVVFDLKGFLDRDLVTARI